MGHVPAGRGRLRADRGLQEVLGTARMPRRRTSRSELVAWGATSVATRKRLRVSTAEADRQLLELAGGTKRAKLCKDCGRPFESTRRDKRFCSATCCHRAAARARKRMAAA
jgi:hypothetical protein